jgi:hypothetical protein
MVLPVGETKTQPTAGLGGLKKDAFWAWVIRARCTLFISYTSSELQFTKLKE